MKRIATTVAAAALAATAISPALAATAGTNATTDNYQAALTAQSNTKLTISEIKSMNHVSNVAILPVTTLGTSKQDKAIQGKLAQKGADVAALQNAIKANTSLMDALKAKDASFKVKNVVAADKMNGRFVVYVIRS